MCKGQQSEEKDHACHVPPIIVKDVSEDSTAASLPCFKHMQLHAGMLSQHPVGAKASGEASSAQRTGKAEACSQGLSA